MSKTISISRELGTRLAFIAILLIGPFTPLPLNSMDYDEKIERKKSEDIITLSEFLALTGFGLDPKTEEPLPVLTDNYSNTDSPQTTIFSSTPEQHQRPETNPQITIVQQSLHSAQTADQVDTIMRACPSRITHRDDEGRTPLHVAAAASNRNVVEALLRWHADVHIQDFSDNYPIHYTGTPEIVELLVNHGADVNARGHGQRTALHQAQTADLVKTLLNLGANPFIFDQELYIPIETVTNPEAKVLLVNHILFQPKRYNLSDGQIDQFILALQADQSLVEALKDNTDSNNNTVLHAAVLQGSYALVKFWLYNQVDPRSTNSDGNTALHYVRIKAIATLMLNSPFKKEFINLQNNHGLTAFDLIAEKYSEHNSNKKELGTILFVLIVQGCKINRENPIHQAIIKQVVPKSLQETLIPSQGTPTSPAQENSSKKHRRHHSLTFISRYKTKKDDKLPASSSSEKEKSSSDRTYDKSPQTILGKNSTAVFITSDRKTKRHSGSTSSQSLSNEETHNNKTYSQSACNSPEDKDKCAIN